MIELTYQDAIKDVRARVKASGTSFAAGMAMLPQERRDAMYALYAFCRVVDDIADDSPTPEIRDQGLALWRARMRALFQDKKSSDSITTALKPAVTNYGLIEEDFQAIIDGMAMDAWTPICAPRMEELDRYCDHVASAVGRVSVRIFGDARPCAMRVAHHLGRALQLTNILRDLHEDAQRDRLYLPSELLTKHGIEALAPQDVLNHPSLKLVCRDLAAVAGQHFDQADAAMKECNGPAMRPARAMRHYYHAILDRLIQEDWADPSKRVSLSVWQKLLIALRGLMA